MVQTAGPVHATVDPDVGDGVSIIIPSWADTPRLRRAIWSIQATADVPYELIVQPSTECVAANRNAGLDVARRDLIVFMDDDVLLPACWLSRLISVLVASPDLGGVSANLVFPDGSPQTRRADLAAGELWEVSIPGTCFVYDRRRVNDLRFDEGYRGSQWEDTDWVWQVQALGLRTVVTGDVTVIHDHKLSHNKWLHQNMQRFHDKWGRLPTADDIVAIEQADYDRWIAPPLPTPPASPRPSAARSRGEAAAGSH